MKRILPLLLILLLILTGCSAPNADSPAADGRRSQAIVWVLERQ